VDSVVAPAAANAFDVTQGSIVKATWIELWLLLDVATGNRATFSITVEKLPSGVTPMTFAQSLNLGAYENKKNILYTTQGLIGSTFDQGSMPVLKQYYLIPKGKQRMGLGDRIVVNIANTSAASMRFCGMSTFKEYR